MVKCGQKNAERNILENIKIFAFVWDCYYSKTNGIMVWL